MTTVEPGGPKYPPAFVWTGDPAVLLANARGYLGMSPSDPDIARLGTIVDTVIELVRSFLDEEVPFDDINQTAPIPSAVYQACLLATVEGYRRKDATFGLAGSFTADGIPVRISNDWLAPVVNVLAPAKERFGVA